MHTRHSSISYGPGSQCDWYWFWSLQLTHSKTRLSANAIPITFRSDSIWSNVVRITLFIHCVISFIPFCCFYRSTIQKCDDFSISCGIIEWLQMYVHWILTKHEMYNILQAKMNSRPGKMRFKIIKIHKIFQFKMLLDAKKSTRSLLCAQYTNDSFIPSFASS